MAETLSPQRPARPPSAHIDDEATARIPAELRDADRWIVWKRHREGNRWRKPPFDPGKPRGKQFIDPHNPSNWMSFEAARNLVHRGGGWTRLLPRSRGV